VKGLSDTAKRVLEARYLLRSEEGKIIESPEEMFRRVAKSIASAEFQYRGYKEAEKKEEEFFLLLSNLLFLPNSPTLMNAGTSLGQLSACFVLPVEDSLDSIFKALSDMAKIQQSGGGTGFDFSNLRPAGDIVKSTRGIASGPVSFMKIFNSATNEIKQGGKRRGANMGILRYDHPDIMEFIRAKLKEGELTNFNISVAVTDEFMDKLKKDEWIFLRNPRTGKRTGRIKAKVLFDEIVESAWKCGDPGLIFLDTINKANPTPELGKITATNPCGEVPLLPYESCNLGSINLSKFVKGKKWQGKIDFEELSKAVHTAVRFLDNVIDLNRYPVPETEIITKGNRKIGLGIMGFAEMLIKMGISYYSKDALKVADEVMRFVKKEAFKASVLLAKERGSFPNIEKSIYRPPLRNATRTSIAPTGSISIIAGTTSGIEPLFSVLMKREEILEGEKFEEINALFVEYIKSRGIKLSSAIDEVREKGFIGNTKLPEDVKRLFITALEIPPEFHVRVQAVFQRHTDNAVSKTVNMKPSATKDDVKKVYLLAHSLKCKGITIYRYGSRQSQVLKMDIGDGFDPSHLFKCEIDCCCPVL
jgi:ribonucleoside-diphosphate reductase alpha chain